MKEVKEDAVCKFKVDDKVRILDKGDKSGWCEEMECTIGMVGVVECLSPDNTMFVVLEEDYVDCWLYSADNLELVDDSDNTEHQEEYSYYKYSYKGIKLDPYRILQVYNVTCPAMQHAIKKLLRAGNSIKGLEQDIQEVIDTLKRKLEMLKEDAE